MENTEPKHDIFVRLKAKKAPKYKAPAELSDKVTMIAVEVSDTQTETEEILDVNIHIQSHSKLTKADAGKISKADAG